MLDDSLAGQLPITPEQAVLIRAAHDRAVITQTELNILLQGILAGHHVKAATNIRVAGTPTEPMLTYQVVDESPNG